MRIISFLLFALLFQVHAIDSYGQESRVSLTASGMKLGQFFKAVEKQTDFMFFYVDSDIEGVDVNVNVKEASVMAALNQALAKTGLTYEINDRYITILPARISQKAQGVTVTGTVTDGSGEPMPGVNVTVKGISTGVITGINGEYSITVSGKDVILIFSFVGYTTQEILVGNNTNLDIVLEEDAREIEEVVVVGYGVQRKVTVTGSISSVNNEQLTQSPAISVTNSLAGRLSGVFGNNRSGEPGANTSSILIRGKSTLGTTSPLYVIDGVWGRGGYNEIDPNDIESVTVLKDASAAIYGAQAANGVILITTKRGADGRKPTINYTMNVALTQPTRIPKMTNAAEYATLYNELLNRQGQPDRFTESEIAKFGDGSDPINYPDTDWVEESFKNFSTQHQHNLSLRGGNNRVKYYVSGNYSKQNSILKGGIHDYTIYGVRSNIDAEVTKNIKIALDLSMTQSNNLRPNQTSAVIFRSIMRNFPWLVAYYLNGLPGTGIERGENPVVMATDAGGYRKTKYNLYQTTFRFDINIPWIEGLGIDGFIAYDQTNTFNKTWFKPWTVYNYIAATDTYEAQLGGRDSEPHLTEESIYANRLILNAKLKYNRRFGQHSINAFIAFEQSLRQENNFSAMRRNFMSDMVDQLFAGDGANQTTDGSASETARRNLLGRLSYGYRDRYLLDFNFRYDGSSIFPKDSRWGFFPGISLAWRLSEEEFIKNISSDINNLKIRASWGQMGNDSVTAFQYLSTYSFTNGYFLGSNPDPVKGLNHGVSPNPNITWEVANTYNLGVDVTLWNGLLGLTADIFKTRRNNILTARNASIPVYTGLSLPNENIGIVENKGFELELSHFNRKNDWQYAIAGNISFARNKIVDIDEAANAQSWQMRTGHPMGTDLYYVTEGIFRTQDEIDANPHPIGTIVGDLKYQDVNGDKEISGDDRVRLDKTNTPEIIFGINLSAAYKYFDFSMLIQGQAKAWQYIYLQSGTSGNTLKDLYDNRYTESNPNSKYPLLTSSSSEVSGFRSTFWLKNASFVRLKNLEIGYTIPRTISSKIKIETMRLYVNGYNLITIDKLKWFDPEGSEEYADFYPQNRIFNLGLNISF